MRNGYNLSSDELADLREYALGNPAVLLHELGAIDGYIRPETLKALGGEKVLQRFFQLIRKRNLRERKNKHILHHGHGFLVEPPTSH